MKKRALTAPILALLICLLRPDGVVFAIPLLLGALLIYPHRVRRFILDILLFVMPGLIYFFWRWHYFGGLFPLPFLVKSDAHRIAHLFVTESVQQGLLFCFFAVISLWLVLHGRMHDVRNRVVLFSLLVLPSLFYFAMRLDQDIGKRFFIYFPVGVAIMIAMNWQSIGHKKVPLLRQATFAWLLCLCCSWIFAMKIFDYNQFDNRKAIAEQLSQLPQGRRITTEAGILPYYSRWQSYDAWGLNTLVPSPIASLQFSSCCFHPAGSEYSFTRGAISNVLYTPSGETPYKDRTWQHLTRNIIAGADPVHYELWMLPYGSLHQSKQNHMATLQRDYDCWVLCAKTSILRTQIKGILCPERRNRITGIQ